MRSKKEISVLKPNTRELNPDLNLQRLTTAGVKEDRDPELRFVTRRRGGREKGDRAREDYRKGDPTTTTDAGIKKKWESSHGHAIRTWPHRSIPQKDDRREAPLLVFIDLL